MRVLVTGANGFVGTALVRRLLRDHDVQALLVVDQRIDAVPEDDRIRVIRGDFGTPQTLDVALATPVDLVFHLASVPGAQAEADPTLGDRINLHGPLALFERLALQTKQHGRAPRVVFASSVAVYGVSLPERMDEHAAVRPTTSYGTHKLIGEQILADWSRRGMLDGRSLRLPGIVARPGLSAGHGSAFMSAIFRAAQIGQPYTCPVSPSAMAWWMSRTCCVDNLLHAARLPADKLHTARVWTPPVLHLSVQTVVDALEQRFGPARIDYAPVEVIERLFGRQPPIVDSRAVAAGFLHDGTVDQLVERALDLSSLRVI
ncbi:NAD-dependent epimerase/dehydratase family protein (plasmid) [Ralstonia sp. R-29]|uniref:NAD-dependent epimerase/dehydratase family protein n=1 Tax=Ralstonia sp. R-29 TaxID=3404059 RepID=UPI003CFB35B5